MKKKNLWGKQLREVVGHPNPATVQKKKTASKSAREIFVGKVTVGKLYPP
ncbi:MAG: hypothetical protein CM15mP120_24160 [Pseudomonadota bacterium]|nr:MAG: hypothetical protein CM15mP120_24160 [Pseudomonadota bacterium]